jgi:xanthine dehydrogenase/oxidase
VACSETLSGAPGTYKIPTANDIPLDLRVTLLRDAPCARTPQVHSSKAVGEPPLFLGACVFFALKARPCLLFNAYPAPGLGQSYLLNINTAALGGLS